MISCVGAPAAAMRRAMPTRPEWPEKPDPSPAAAAAACMRREIDGADSPNSDADPSAHRPAASPPAPPPTPASGRRCAPPRPSSSGPRAAGPNRHPSAPRRPRPARPPRRGAGPRPTAPGTARYRPARGVAVGLGSSIHGALVDEVSYDFGHC